MSRARRTLLSLVDRWLALPPGARALLPSGIMAVLWWSSSQPPKHEPASVLRVFLHNGAHPVAWFGLATAFALLLLTRDRARGGGLPARVGVLSVALAVVYGFVDEWHQSFVPGRDCSLWDVANDLGGSLIAVSMLSWLLSGSRRMVFLAASLVVLTLLGVGVASW